MLIIKFSSTTTFMTTKLIQYKIVFDNNGIYGD